MEKVNITIIGAGVIGLAIARELSKHYQDIFVIERNSTFGQETSSRNSEVIHAGIYYPGDSLKAKTCIEGKFLLYAFCLEHGVAHKKIGKVIVAIDKSEVKDLESLLNNGLDNGVRDLIFLSKVQLKKFEPHVEAEAAIYSPSTGILDTHGLMKAFESQFKNNSGVIAYNTELIGIEKKRDGLEIAVEDKAEGVFKFLSRIVINAAGLYSDKIAGMVGLAKDEFKLKYCKGDYFRVHNNKGKYIKRLVYPVPKKERAGLGIHATLDLTGSLRLGPDDEYVQRIGYDVDASKAKTFYENTRTFLPFIELKDLSPDMAGIRPKLQGRGEAFRDFIIKDETDSGVEGFINLIGIESPGLTASLAIARQVKALVDKICT